MFRGSRKPTFGGGGTLLTGGHYFLKVGRGTQITEGDQNPDLSETSSTKGTRANIISLVCDKHIRVDKEHSSDGVRSQLERSQTRRKLI